MQGQVEIRRSYEISLVKCFVAVLDRNKKARGWKAVLEQYPNDIRTAHIHILECRDEICYVVDRFHTTPAPTPGGGKAAVSIEIGWARPRLSTCRSVVDTTPHPHHAMCSEYELKSTL